MHTGRKRHILFILSLGIGACLAISYYLNEVQNVKESKQSLFNRSSEKFYSRQLAKVTAVKTKLDSLKSFFKASSHVSNEEFLVFTKEGGEIKYCFFSNEGEIVSSYADKICQKIDILSDSQIIYEGKYYLTLTSFVKTSDDQKGFVSVFIPLIFLKDELPKIIENSQYIFLNKSTNNIFTYDMNTENVPEKSDSLDKSSELTWKKTLLDLKDHKMVLFNVLSRNYHRDVPLEHKVYSLLFFLIFVVIGVFYFTLMRQKELVELEVLSRTEELENEIKKRRIAQSEAERFSKIKSEFLANMSHEIRTPMNGVLGVVDLLESTDINKEQSEYLSILKTSGNNLVSLINDILDLSKLEEKKMTLDKDWFSLKKSIKNSMTLFHSLAREKDIFINCALNVDDNIEIRSDERRFSQIMNNLLSNAIKFTPMGDVTIILDTRFTSHALEVSIKVKDTGIGMDEKTLKGLFKPFTQGDASLTKSFGGTGLGLAISHHIVTLMGGAVSATSKAGIGSEFSLAFPFEYRATMRPAEVVPENKKEDGLLSERIPLSILIVEDNHINLKIISRMITKLGYTPDSAHDGLEACEMTKKKSYDLIFMDLMMPRMDGLTATEIILKQSGGRETIFSMTANAMKEDEERCMAVGMKEFLTKPIKKKEMAQAIMKHFAV